MVTSDIALSLKTNMRKLWADHVIWTRQYIIAAVRTALSPPHIFVLESGRMLRYKGRIDDSRDPAKATYSDLEHALEDVLAQRTVKMPETKPFGCAIVR